MSLCGSPLTPKKRRRALSRSPSLGSYNPVSGSEEPVPSSSSLPSPPKRARLDRPQTRFPCGPLTNFEVSDELCYRSTNKAVQETEEFRLVEEAEPEDLEQDESDPDVPIRLLQDFVIYDPSNNNQIVPLDLLERSDGHDRNFVAVGYVWPVFDSGYVERENVEEEYSPILLQTGSIMSFCIAYGDEDMRPYIQTQWAYYILQRPAVDYALAYRTFWSTHRLTQLVFFASMEGETYSSFLDALIRDNVPLDGIVSTTDILGRGFREDDVRFCQDEIVSLVRENDESKAIWTSTLLRSLRARKQRMSSTSTQRTPHPRLQSTKPPVRVKSCRPEEPAPTAVSRFIHVLAAPFHLAPMEALDFRDQSGLEKYEIPSGDGAIVDDTAMLHDNLAQPFIKVSHSVGQQDSRSVEVQFKTGWHRFTLGDTIMVSPGGDTNKKRAINATQRAAQSQNSIANIVWFAVLNAILDDSEEPRAHVQWFDHGCKTFLQELSGPQELYLTEECDIIPVASFLGVVDLHVPTTHQNPEAGTQFSSSSFFVRYLLDKEDYSLTDVGPTLDRAQHYLSRPVPTFCTHTSHPDHKSVSPRWEGNATEVLYGGRAYHPHDFVFLAGKAPAKPYRIGQVIEIRVQDRNDPEFLIKIYKRSDDDNVRLLATQRTSIFKMESLRGHCEVLAFSLSASEDEIESALHHDTFYLVATTLPPVCRICQHKRRQSDQLRSKFLVDLLTGTDFATLRSLDIFSGSGGLTCGFDGSPAIQTRWAIEKDLSAASTYRQNFPGVEVLNQCSNVILKYAASRITASRPSYDSLLADQPDNVPMPGELDFIYCGPPCQGFSGLNRSRAEGDSRVTLVLNALSYVDLYRPSYFLLENVLGILSYKLRDKSPDVGNEPRIIEKGMVKMICRALTEMNYQVRFNVLQGGLYGVPQSRNRVIFIASKRGIPLPPFPVPSHTFSGKLFSIKLATEEQVCRVVQHGQSAPHKGITVGEAIGDLPQFDWKNPHIKLQNHEELQDRNARRGLAIPSYDATGRKHGSNMTGFLDATEYHLPVPQSRYQRVMREGLEKVTQQYTGCVRVIEAERVNNLPVQVGANPNDINYQDLPRSLAPDFLRDVAEERLRDFKDRYGRLMETGVFPVSVTTVNASGGRVVHYEQHRVLTVREAARSQGFPDRFQFGCYGGVKEMYRQIGNAVPVPLAVALGRAIEDSLFGRWKAQQGEGIQEDDMLLDVLLD